MQPVAAGIGVVQEKENGWSLKLPPTPSGYHNAQLWNYVQLSSPRSPVQLQNRPPLRLSLTAYATGNPEEFVGTAGFGFWNHPFSPDRYRFPRLPRALWFFFASKQSNMALDYNVPGNGWKCGVIDAINPRALALMPLALPAALAMRSKKVYAKLYPSIQRALKIDEHPIPLNLLRERHHYQIDWMLDHVEFSIDHEPVFITSFSPSGPLGLVIWMDTRYAIVTPQANIGFGVEAVKQAQGLEIEALKIES